MWYAEILGASECFALIFYLYRFRRRYLSIVHARTPYFYKEGHICSSYAACELPEAGCTDEEIGAITGQTVRTVQHYTNSVQQKANASVVIQHVSGC